VIDAVIESAIPVTANMMPYHRRRGVNRCPVTVASGVIVTARKKQISPPVPSVSASVLVRDSLSFSDIQPRSVKSIGTSAGSRRRNSAIFRLLIPGSSLDSWSSQDSRDCRFSGLSAYSCSSSA
jgi:hypothetical protein